MYHATMDLGPEADFPTITEARRWAEEFGSTANRCEIIALDRWEPRSDHPFRIRPVVAVHVRDTAGDGRRWHRADPGPRMIDDGATIDRDPLARLGRP